MLELKRVDFKYHVFSQETIPRTHLYHVGVVMNGPCIHGDAMDQIFVLCHAPQRWFLVKEIKDLLTGKRTAKAFDTVDYYKSPF